MRTEVSSESRSETPLNCSVVIATWQRPELLRTTLRSIERQTYQSFEVIVVSDGEDDSIRELVREFQPGYPLRCYFHSINRGQAAARNTGAREASGAVLLFLDDDVEADSELIKRHLDHHSTDNEDCRLAVGGRIAEERREPLPNPTDKYLQESWEHTLESFAVQLTEPGVDSIGEGVERAISFGLNCSIGRAVFLQFGGFN